MENTIKNNKINDYSKENRNAIIKLVIVRIISYSFLILLSAFCIFFFYLLLINTTKSNNQLQAGKISLIPSTSFFTNLKNLFTSFRGEFNALSGFFNSLVIAGFSSILTCYFSTFILAIMMIPTQLSSVGFFQLACKMNLKNELWVLIIPAIASPACFFYMIQYLRATLPKDLIEASRIDGSNEFMTFNRVVIPIMKPAIAVQFIFSFVASWNNLYMPSLLLTDPNKKTLPVMINALQHTSWGSLDLGCVYMAIFLSILPVVIVYLILSKFIIKGVTAGSVKG